jgi:hypothetical protein
MPQIIFKQETPVANVIEDIRKLGKGLILGRPGNNLERNDHYSIRNNLNFNTEKTSNTHTLHSNNYVPIPTKESRNNAIALHGVTPNQHVHRWINTPVL